MHLYVYWTQHSRQQIFQAFHKPDRAAFFVFDSIRSLVDGDKYTCTNVNKPIPSELLDVEAFWQENRFNRTVENAANLIGKWEEYMHYALGKRSLCHALKEVTPVE